MQISMTSATWDSATDSSQTLKPLFALAQGLLDSLGFLFTNAANDYADYQAANQDALNVAQIPQDALGIPAHIAFIGGAGDSSSSHIMEDLAAQYQAAHPTLDVEYFTWDQGAQLAAWANEVNTFGGNVTIMGHSYGADTAATVVASGVHVQTLVTLDPVSYSTPSLSAVAANSGQWLDFVANGGGLTQSNVVAGFGGAWNNQPVGYADSVLSVNLDHAAIGGVLGRQLLGLPHQ